MEKKKEELDVKRLNGVIKISSKILNILLVLIVAVVVYVVTRVAIDWHVLGTIGNFLEILLPLFIGIAIAWLFEPFVTYLHEKGVNRILGALFTFVLFFLVITILGFLIVPTFTSQINDIITSIPTLITSVTNWINGLFDGISEATGYNLASVEQGIYTFITNIGTRLTTDMPSTVINTIKGVINGSVTFVFGLMIGFYMLYDFHSVKKHIKDLLPTKYRDTTIGLLKKIDKTLRNYIQGTLTIMLLLFIIQSISLTLVGIKAPLVFALFCAITDIIPYVGPWIGAIPVIVVGFATSPLTGILSIVAVVVAQSIENYFLQPVVMGKTMKLHPVTVMIGLLIFQHYFGIIGMILATPTISIIKVLFEFVNDKYNLLSLVEKND